MNQRPICAAGLVALGITWVVPAFAHSLTMSECTEGGEFIRNAALARDNGVTRQYFVSRLTEDLTLIRAFPPQLRWFVQDARDEQLLTQAVFEVFDTPVKAEQHETEFIGNCIAAAAS